MKRMMLVGGLVAVVLCGGCASAVKKVDVNKGLDPASHSYAGQAAITTSSGAWIC